MCKRLIFLISFVLVLSLAGSAWAQPFETAVAIWNLADPCDENGPPFTNLDETYFDAYVDPTQVTGAESAEHWDGWALPSAEDWISSYTELYPPDGNELLIEGAVSILARVRMAGWVEGIEVVTGIYDGGCGDTVPSYGIEFQDLGHPTFAVTAAGTRERVEVSLAEAVEVDTWYDILGIFDPDNDTLSISVFNSATGSEIDSNSVPVTFDALDYTDLPEIELFCSPCAELSYPEAFAYIEVVAVWAEAVGVVRGARNPRPADEALRVSPDGLELIWDKDPCAVPSNEDVYFSHDFQDVNGRTALKSIQDANNWPTGDVNLGMSYYWAIDEIVDVCAALGPVWSFTVIDVNAENPSPQDDAEYVGPCPTLEWDPGYGAVSHKVYFSEVEADIAGRTIDPCATLNEPCAEEYSPGTLDWDTEYFWAVDEVNAGDVCAPGPVWSFTVGPDPVTDLPDWRGDTDTFYANWAFDANWQEPVGDGKLYATDYGIVPATPSFEPNCVDPPYDWLATHLGRSGIADANGPAGGDGENSIRLRHNDYAIAGESVTVRVGIISYSGPPASVEIQRLVGWGDGIDPEDGLETMNESEPDPLYSFELCDDWTYSLYEVEFELIDPAHNIHVVINTDGEFYLDSVVVDAHWRHPPEAHGPQPTDGEEGVSSDLCILTWYPGSDVALAPNGGHDVYLGTDWDDVNDANANDPVGVIYQGRQDANYYPDAGCLPPLDLAQTYYWRVDEVNDNDPCVWKGYVWSFTTIAWDLLDDFELYTGTSDLEDTWHDYHTKYNGNTKGNAAAVVLGIDPDPFISPIQSMKYDYDWSAAQEPKYCVVWQTFDSPQNWTEKDAALLVLWFNGDANDGLAEPNYADGMSVTLADDDNSDGTIDDSWTIEYDGDFRDLIAKEWMYWALPFQDFIDNGNVNFDKIKQIEIRIIGGSSGQIWFDDFRLYAAACTPELAPDFTGDCVWNEEDLALLSQDEVWLDEDFDIDVVPVEPCDVNLILWYTFDPCAASPDINVYDYSGNAYHGIELNEVNVHDGILTLKNATAMVYDPKKDVWSHSGVRPTDFNSVEVGGDFNSLDVWSSAYSVMVEYRVDACQPDLDMIILEVDFWGSECDTSISMYIGQDCFDMLGYPDTYGLASDHTCVGGVGKISQTLIDGNWHRMVFTYDPENVDPQTGFHHGIHTDVYSPFMLDVWETEPFTNDMQPERDWKTLIGVTLTNTDVWSQNIEHFTGDVNEIRIYDYALTPAEVQAIAADPPVPLLIKHFVDPVFNLYEDGEPEVVDSDIINFKDFGVMANKWLEVELY